MKDVRKTIGSLIDRQSTAFIGSVSAEGSLMLRQCSHQENGSG